MAEPTDPPPAPPTGLPWDSPADLPATDADGRSVSAWLAAVLVGGGDGPLAALTRADKDGADRGCADKDGADKDGADKDGADKDGADPDLMAVRFPAERLPAERLRAERLPADRMPAWHQPSALARADRLPIRDNALAEVHVLLCMPGLARLDALFGELRRVLRPTGTLVALVPACPRASIAELRAWWPVHRALGGAPRFRNESARDRLSWLFTAADFAVLVEQRRTFWLPVPDAHSAPQVVAALVRSGVWPGDLAPERLAAAASALARVAGPRTRLPVPLRLLIGRR